MHPFEDLDLLLRLGPELGIKFLVAVVCGGAIGLERELSGKPAGLRTNILICLGSMLFTAMSMEVARRFGGDASRITAQIVSGIGFLGAGAILHRTEGGVKGMTTAALIWLMAAIGVLIGAGYPIISLAFTLVTVVLILALRPLETFMNNRQARDYRIRLPGDGECRPNAERILQRYNEFVRDPIFRSEEDGHPVLTYRFIGPAYLRHELLTQLVRVGGKSIDTELPGDD
jgi:putative Mg2+ transporter-C (MgtC) family protein